MTNSDLNAKYGAFVVTRYDANRMKSAPIPGHVYPTIEQACAAAGRLESGKRYANQPPLMVDIASVYGLKPA